jgi:hypothetical protein
MHYEPGAVAGERMENLTAYGKQNVSLCTLRYDSVLGGGSLRYNQRITGN